MLPSFLKLHLLHRQLKLFGAKAGTCSLKSAYHFNFERGADLNQIKCIGKDFLLTIGGDSYWRSGTAIGNVSIGRFCSIAKDVVIGLEKNGHPSNWLSSSPAQHSKSILSKHRTLQALIYQPKLYTTTISSDVWIGDKATIMNGLTIGVGAIIAAGSIVTKSIPAYAIVAGTPATIIKYRFSSELIQRLLSSRWWSLPPHLLANLPFKSPEDCLMLLEEKDSNFTATQTLNSDGYGKLIIKGLKKP